MTETTPGAAGTAAPRAPRTERRDRRDPWSVGLDVLLVGLLLAAAALLRAPALGPSSLWLDDAWVALVHRTEGLQELRYVGFAAPGFVAGLKAWSAVVGTSELAAQLPAYLAGVLAPAAAYVLARWRRWHRAAALLAGTVLVTSPIAITYATRVKQYTTEALLAVLLVALALWLLDDRSDPRRWAALVGVGGLATVVSAFLAPTVAAGLLAALVAALRARDRVAVQQAVGWGVLYGVAALAWYLGVLAPAVTTSISGFWADGFLTVDQGVGPLLTSLRVAGAGVLEGLLSVAGWEPAWVASAAAPAWVPAGVGAWIGAVILLAAALALVVLGRQPEVAVLLLTPLAIAVVLAGLQLAPLGGGRTDVYLYPSLALLLAAGVDVALRRLQRWDRRAAVAGSAGVLVGVVALAAATQPVGAYPAYDVRPLAVEVERRAGGDDAILVYPATVWAYALYTEGAIHLDAEPVSSWGFAPRFGDDRVVVLPPGRDDPGAYLPTVTSLGESEVEVVWLLASHWRDDIEDLRGQLADVGFTVAEVAERDGARLERWERGV